MLYVLAVEIGGLRLAKQHHFEHFSNFFFIPLYRISPVVLLCSLNCYLALFCHKYDWTGVVPPLTVFPAVLLQHSTGEICCIVLLDRVGNDQTLDGGLSCRIWQFYCQKMVRKVWLANKDRPLAVGCSSSFCIPFGSNTETAAVWPASKIRK